MILNRGSGQWQPVSLAQAEVCGAYLVESVSGPEQHRLRLCEMGIVAGAPISILSRSNQGMLVVKVGRSKMALSPGSTEHVQVRKTTSR